MSPNEDTTQCWKVRIGDRAVITCWTEKDALSLLYSWRQGTVEGPLPWRGEKNGACQRV